MSVPVSELPVRTAFRWFTNLFKWRKKRPVYAPERYGKWYIVIQPNGGEWLRASEPIECTYAQAQLEARDVSELYMANIVMETGDIAMCNYGVRAADE